MNKTDAQLIVSAVGRAVRKLFDPLRTNVTQLTEKLINAETLIAEQRSVIDQLTRNLSEMSGRVTERFQAIEQVCTSIKNTAPTAAPSAEEIARHVTLPTMPTADAVAAIVLRDLPLDTIISKARQAIQLPTVEEIASHVTVPKAETIVADVQRLLQTPVVPTAQEIADLVPRPPSIEEVAEQVRKILPSAEQIAKHVSVPAKEDIVIEVQRSIQVPSAQEIAASLPSPPSIDEIAAKVKQTLPNAAEIAALVVVPDAQAIVTEVQRSIHIPAVPTPEQVAAAMPAPITAADVVKLISVDEIVDRVTQNIPSAAEIAKFVQAPSVPSAEEVAKHVVVPSAADIAKLVPVPELPTLTPPELPHVPTLDEIVDRLKQLLPSLIPAPIKGEKGDSITIEDVRPLIEASIAKLPKPQDGKSLTIEDVKPLFAQWVLEFERRAVDRHDQILAQLPKPKDGRDGVGFDDLVASMDMDAKQLILTFKRDGADARSFSMFVPFLVHRGVYRSESKYLQGDCVTRGGSTWMAVKNDPVGEPSDGKSLDWRLIVKRGNDGRDGKDPSAPARVRIPPRKES